MHLARGANCVAKASRMCSRASGITGPPTCVSGSFHGFHSRTPFCSTGARSTLIDHAELRSYLCSFNYSYTKAHHHSPNGHTRCYCVGASLALKSLRTVQPFTRRLLHTAKQVLAQAGGGAGGGSSITSGGGGGGGGGGSGSGGLWPTYLRLLERSPLFTKAWTAGLLNGLGDLVSQKFVEKNEDLDLKRLGIFTLLGSVLVGPGLHFWYGFIGRTVTAAGTSGALIRLGLDQLLWAPVFISTFLASLLTLEGKGHEVKNKLRNDLKPTVIANWKLWVPAQFINFRMVPPHLQVAFSNIVAVGWNTYLSWASHHSATSSNAPL